nr:MAG TPA: hypothetical protein [Caudoviricetes sp.]
MTNDVERVHHRGPYRRHRSGEPWWSDEIQAVFRLAGRSTE